MDESEDAVVESASLGTTTFAGAGKSDNHDAIDDFVEENVAAILLDGWANALVEDLLNLLVDLWRCVVFGEEADKTRLGSSDDGQHEK